MAEVNRREIFLRRKRERTYPTLNESGIHPEYFELPDDVLDKIRINFPIKSIDANDPCNLV